MTPEPGGVASDLGGIAALTPDQALEAMRSGEGGLQPDDAARRLARTGANVIAREATMTVWRELLGCVRNPLNALLLVLAVTSALLGDRWASLIIATMVALSIGLAFIQQHRSNRAAAELRALVRTIARVRRGGQVLDVPIEQVVPGDVVQLGAGDLIPCDLRVIASKDLHVDQSALTGEAMPVDKQHQAVTAATASSLDLDNLCFMGCSVLSGTGMGVALLTGGATQFGKLADQTVGRRAHTDFERGVRSFTWLMISLIGVMVPAVFVINGTMKGDWIEALFFALAVAVGMTPEMLPAIVTVNLAKGAVAMSRKRVITKRLEAIQNFGAMDVLCTDKTGTLTQNRIVLQYHLDPFGRPSDAVFAYAFLNSHHQSGLRNLLDDAVLAHAQRPEHAGIGEYTTKVDEIPFDFQRRRMSVVLDRGDGRHLIVTKGAVEETIAVCDRWGSDGESGALDPSHLAQVAAETAQLNGDGFRVVAVATREIETPRSAYSVADESGMTLVGYVAFLDPPKESATPALAALASYGIKVKILTGDNDLVTRAVCRQVGLAAGSPVLGTDIARMSDDELAQAVARESVFAKLQPEQKARVIEALRSHGHVVGYLGDGINDGPALRAADVGISVDTAVDIARESADIILLEKSLAVLAEGVLEGRKVFGNILKYIRMGASSNFGNMLSVLGASVFLPFLPMLPLQILTNNLLYDLSQAAIPTDDVDDEFLRAPRRWDVSNIFRFIVLIGPISSIFDYATFGALIWIFGAWSHPALFQTGWFVESLLSQTLIIHMIRTAKVPFVESRASNALMFTTGAVCAVGLALPFTGLRSGLGFVPLPAGYWPVVLGLLLLYASLTQLAKSMFVRRWGL